MQQPNGLICVWMNVDRKYDEELHAWYETEHVPELMEVDGFLSGRRYYGDDCRLRYLVLYEATDEGVEPGKGFQTAIAHPTPWTARIRLLFGENRRRSNYRRLLDAGPGSSADRSPQAIVTVDRDERPDASARKELVSQFKGCSRYRAFADAAKAPLGFEIFDFDDLASARKAAAELTAPGCRVEVRTAVGEPRTRRT